ncbi:hypothetical protein F5Y19DRAFT_450008 [Xylariaceae sp. FL1651]|nr:hypothetical protein F5Y19DRAFT_450008 [Xylariaceae sp. FL1651]
MDIVSKVALLSSVYCLGATPAGWCSPVQEKQQSLLQGQRKRQTICKLTSANRRGLLQIAVSKQQGQNRHWRGRHRSITVASQRKSSPDR